MLLISIYPARTTHGSIYATAIAGFFGLAIAMGVGRFAFTPILPLMQAEARLSVTDGAWLSAANYLGYLVGALTAMAFSGRSVFFIRAAIVFIAATTFGMAATEHTSAWLLLRFAAGVASAFLLVFVSAWSLERISSAGRPRLAGLIFSGVGGGIFLVGAVCLAMERLHAHYDEVWVVLGVLSVLLGIVAWPLFAVEREHAPVVRQTDQPARRTLVRARRLVLSYGLLGFGYIVPATFLPVIARAMFVDANRMDVSWIAFGLAACISTLLAALAGSRVSERRVWSVAQAVMAIGVALPAFVTTPAAVIAAALCVGGTFMVVTMAGMQSAKRLGGESARPLMARMTAAFATGQLAGPLTVPFLIRPGADFSTVLGLAAIALLVGVFVLPSGDHTHETYSQ